MVAFRESVNASPRTTPTHLTGAVNGTRIWPAAGVETVPMVAASGADTIVTVEDADEHCGPETPLSAMAQHW